MTIWPLAEYNNMNRQLRDKDLASSKDAGAGGGGERGGSNRIIDTANRTQRAATARTLTPMAPSSRLWLGLKDPRIVRVSRALGGKDRHSKVSTVRGLRDRRVRLSVQTAIQLYDLQDRLGLSQPSKVVDWLLAAAQQEIDKLPPLHFPPHFLHVGRVVPSTATTTGGALGYADRTQQIAVQQPASGRRADHGWATTNWGCINTVGGQEGDHQRPSDEEQNNDNGREVGQQSNSAISYYHLVANQSNSGVATTSAGAAAQLAVGCYALQPTAPMDDANSQYYGYRPAPASPLSLLPALGGCNSQTSATALLFCPSGAMPAPSVFQASHASSFDPKLLGHFHSGASTANSALAPP